MKETIQELEQELRDRRQEEYERERIERLKKEQEFKEKHKVNTYWASDYAGLEAGDYSFYYGYEETFCPKHKNKNCEDYGCELREWCFVAKIKDKEVMRIPSSKLWFEYKEPMEMLLLGIGHYFSQTTCVK